MNMGRLKTELVTTLTFVLALLFPGLSQTAFAKDASSVQHMSDAELAQKLNNPIADIMIIPIQMNYDSNIGLEDEGWRLQTKIQPVIPFKLTEDLDLISRTIIPLTYREDTFPGEGSQFGLGDINLSLFLAPPPTSGGLIWGVGSVFLLPTATDETLGAEKWGAGPAALALKMRGPWTFGGQVNHLWSFAGDSERTDISSSLLQPFVAYTWPNAWNVSLQSESTYNWKAEKWSVPVNATIGKLVRWGKLPVKWRAGVGYWLESPEAGPEGVRFQLQANFVLPR